MTLDRLDPAWAEQLRRAEGISRVVWHGTHETIAEDPRPGRLGQYELLEQIGRGGMGTVYKAMHVRLKRHVALKLLPAGRVHGNQAVARFQREMEAVGRLDHPNLVRAFDAGEEEGRHFLAMEYLEGTDLARLVRERGPLSVPDACEIVRQAAVGLHHAHEHGLVHRDVKPSNLMLTSGGEIKVLDLGLARLVEAPSDVPNVTAAEQVVGTADFMAPEQAGDTQTADSHSDVYALGATLYFLLAGHAPFGDAEHRTFISKVVAHASEPVPPLGRLRPRVPKSLVAVIERMLAKEPKRRFPSMAEVATALEPYSAGSDLKAALVANRAAGGSSPTRSQARRYGWAIVSLGIAGLAAGAFHRVSGRGETDKGQRTDNSAVASITPSTLPPTTTSVASRPAEQITNSVGMTLRLIPADEFVMGSPESDVDAAPDEKPQHKVTITRPFYLATTEVTVGQFRQFVKATGYRTQAEREGTGGWQSDNAGSKARRTRDTTWDHPGFWQTDEHPVTVVSWHDAGAFCAWLTGKEGVEYRLPTEAEWEYACRAGTADIRFIRAEPLDQFQWGLVNAGLRTWPVEKKLPNPWGLYDAYGNAREWVADWYDEDYYRVSPATDPAGPTKGEKKVIRGSSFMDLPPFIRSAKRLQNLPDDRLNNLGFRVARGTTGS